jgi:hypothetical protein
MKSALRLFRRPAKPTARLPMHHERALPVRDVPAFGEVLAEIGLILAIHLGAALAITLTLRVSGIVLG